MRSTADRIRHAISFEIIGLALITPLGALAFGMPMADIGVIGVASATIATGWNYLYNLGFDHLMQRLTGGTQKTVAIRVAHAALFEGGLLLVLLPLIAWYLGVSLLQALMMDVSFALFYMVYAFVFNWVYDRVFPLPDWQIAADASQG
ncbi:PACE efflux transporter [Rhizobium sp. S96]|uniref:PACE efflux transporter n=1 Tax=Rhizobium sp. S96 TaxID=3055140 RepID=UPI0025AA35BE|nr:PACE efflux transporter [Rhizobium sp. S96]MDM9619570.1 PACE efflux transporter [Rhizobium sp. S96]